MLGAAVVAVLATVALVATGCEPPRPSSCPAPSVSEADASGHSRCVGLAERVRIRLAVERGVSTATLARRHRLSAASIRRIATDPGARILPGAGAATDLRAEPGCSLANAQPKARLVWAPADAGRQVVIVAPEHVGLADGRFWSGRLLASDRSRVVWHRFAGQAMHVWAAITRERNGWRPSRPGSFTGPLCAIDVEP